MTGRKLAGDCGIGRPGGRGALRCGGWRSGTFSWRNGLRWSARHWRTSRARWWMRACSNRRRRSPRDRAGRIGSRRHDGGPRWGRREPRVIAGGADHGKRVLRAGGLAGAGCHRDGAAARLSRTTGAAVCERFVPAIGLSADGQTGAPALRFAGAAGNRSRARGTPARTIRLGAGGGGRVPDELATVDGIAETTATRIRWAVEEAPGSYEA